MKKLLKYLTVSVLSHVAAWSLVGEYANYTVSPSRWGLYWSDLFYVTQFTGTGVGCSWAQTVPVSVALRIKGINLILGHVH